MNETRALLDAVTEFVEVCAQPQPNAAVVTELQAAIFEAVDRLAAQARQRAGTPG